MARKKGNTRKAKDGGSATPEVLIAIVTSPHFSPGGNHAWTENAWLVWREHVSACQQGKEQGRMAEPGGTSQVGDFFLC